MESPGPNAPQKPTTESIRLGHARALDGVRGIAVLAVLAQHLKLSWLKGGYYGVDMFFALSGFLITTLLIEEYTRHGKIRLTNFFRRRFFRLYPALVVVVAFGALSSLTRPDVNLERVALVVGSILSYLSNWLLISNPEAWIGGLGQTWSLAVEVHFYILWAVTLALFLRRRPLNFKAMMTLALAVAVSSAIWRMAIWATSTETARAYAGTDTRLDAVFLGVAAAFVRLEQLGNPTENSIARLSCGKIRTLEILAVISVSWLVIMIPAISPVTYLLGFIFVGASTAMVILTTLLSPHSILAGPLQNRGLIWFGKISYSLYLWHLPVMKFVTSEQVARYVARPWQTAILGTLISVTLAALSYYFIERFFLKLGRKASQPTAA